MSIPSNARQGGLRPSRRNLHSCMHSSPEEEKRLEAVRALDLLGKPEEERFQRITRLARRHFRVARCAITLVDENLAYSVALDGSERRGPQNRSETLCNNVVEGKAPLVISEQSTDADSSLYKDLVRRLDLHFYAGVPIISPEGHAVGALCIVDHVPRRFSRRDMESLADFAAIVEDELMVKRADSTRRELIGQVERLRIKAFVDPLTSVWNRGAIFDILLRETERARRVGHPLSVCLMDLDHFKRFNDTYGHQVGDLVLQETCLRARNCIRPYDALGRYGGEEFLVVFPDTNAEQSTAQAERIREAIGNRAFDLGNGAEDNVTISIGVAVFSGDEQVDDLISRADQALYRAKREGRNRVIRGE